ncbi:carbon starvation CstA family protein [Selenomonas montiformis]|uniref:Carbon starvation protein A n=1 Tax=Selenomonas montiformis TaxID=2652285 RepID=A0A6I2V241_9FIRM|nr:carbon starvation CstA family protein [Selenomonas montiformis]MSV25706.1 carbon starvation protein A [Selenomonas montiformis]
MNGLTIVGLAIVVFVAAYAGYGRWLVKTWGIDPRAKTPAVKYEDGQDFAPASRFTVFSHQFSSITGAGPVTGPIIAAMFGWAPALLWLLVGGVFFGAVQDFTALYASVKNEGKSMGMLIEQYVGKTGRRLFLLFCWLFTLLVLAAFADIIANTFNGMTKAGAPNVPGAQAASISMLYIFVAMGFGFFIRKVNPSGVVKFLVAVVLVLAMFAVGMQSPLYFDAQTWRYVTFGYCFIASVLPMWLLMEPRDYLSAFLLLGMVFGGVVGVIVANPSINMPAFVGFEVNGKSLFPILFITIACGAVSGFHSLVSSGTSSKAIAKEDDMLPVGYGAMLVESLLGVVALVIACAAASNGVLPKGTPFQIFAGAISGFFQMFGLPAGVSACVITMCVSALAMTTIDSVARIGRMSFQELFTPSEGEKPGAVASLCMNTYFSTVITLFLAFFLCMAGYMNIWPLFGAANQLLSALVLISLAVFLRTTGRKGWMLYVPMTFMFIVTMTALVMSVAGGIAKLQAGSFVPMIDGLQLILALALMTLAVLVVKHCGKELISGKAEMPQPEE